MAAPRAQLTVTTDGRFLCVEVMNLGAASTFSGVVQPGRGTASAAVARPALWSDATESDRRIERGQSATFRVAQRDRPAGDHEDDDRKHVHPEGPQAWRMCFLKHGVGAALEGVLAIDADTGNEFRVLDSPRHYHAKTF